MSHCRVISHWFYDEGGESYGAEIEQNYPSLGLRDLVNVPNIPPTPNIGVWESETGDGEGITKQIIADPAYGEPAVITTHDTEAQVPSQERFERISTYLVGKGMSVEQVEAAIGTTPGTRTNWDVSQDLIAWLKLL